MADILHRNCFKETPPFRMGEELKLAFYFLIITLQKYKCFRRKQNYFAKIIIFYTFF